MLHNKTRPINPNTTTLVYLYNMNKNFVKYFYVIAGILSIGVVPLALLFFNQLPNDIPLFIALSGDVIKETPKTVLSVLRLPFMAITMYFIIATLYIASSRYSTDAKQDIAIFWIGLATLFSVKMLLANFSIFFIIDNQLNEIGKVFHTTSTIAALLGVGLILASLPKLTRMKKIGSELGVKDKIVIVVLVFIYGLFVVFPFA